MSSSYTEVSFEHRDGGDMKKSQFSVYNDPDELRERFAKTKRNKTDKKTKIGKSKNKSKWEITEYINDIKSEKTEDYDQNDFHSVLSDFGVDVKPIFNKSAPSAAKSSSTKSSSTKSGKKDVPKKKSSKKKSIKKKSSKKKSSEKKSSKKKSSKKKTGGSKKKRSSMKKKSLKKKTSSSKKKSLKKKIIKKKAGIQDDHQKENTLFQEDDHQKENTLFQEKNV
jgi:hypothetical protein